MKLNRTRISAKCLAPLLFSLTNLPAGATDYYVDNNPRVIVNGTSWETAYPTLQSALSAAQSSGGGTIHVAGGQIFYADENTVGDSPDSTFDVPADTIILGGYDPFQSYTRTPELTPTVLSGDLTQDDVDADGDGIVQVPEDQSGVNAYHVVTVTGDSVRVSGCVITAGSATYIDNERFGGGMLIRGRDVQIKRCDFRGNTAEFGGAIAANAPDAVDILRCRFSGNSSTTNGGAIYLRNGPTPVTFSDCAFLGNRSLLGGAIYSDGADARLVNMSFSGNRAITQGGALAAVNVGRFDLTNSIIWNNHAGIGRDTPTASFYRTQDSTTSYGSSIIENLIGEDPKFADPPDPTAAPSSDGDLKLGPVSPAIDVGDDSANLRQFDLPGNPRITEGGIDLGAYERAAGYYVDASVAANGDGRTWETAFRSIQEATDIATAGTGIYVAAGVYYANEGAIVTPGKDPRSFSFEVPEGCALVGGFPTGGGARDTQANPTILSGDIDQNDLNDDGNFIAEDPAHIVGGNSYTVVQLSGSDPLLKTFMIGMTITGGPADYRATGVPTDRDSGAGVQCYSLGNMEIDDCRIVSNVAIESAGMSIQSAEKLQISHCYIGYNFSRSDPESGYTPFIGGLGVVSSTEVVVRNCVFEGNESPNLAQAFHFSTNESVKIEYCVVENHMAEFETSFSDIFCMINCELVEISRCHLRGNRPQGGRLAFLDGNTEVRLTDCVITGNEIANQLAELFLFRIQDNDVAMTNCTIAGNASPAVFDKDGFGGSTVVRLSNCAIKNTPLLQGADLPDGFEFEIQHSAIEGQPGGSDGNLDGSTRFEFINPRTPDEAPTTTGNYALLPGSPLIDAGLNSLSTSETDILGGSRFFDGDGDIIPTVDIGAYEFQGSGPTAEFEIVSFEVSPLDGDIALTVESDSSVQVLIEFSEDLKDWSNGTGTLLSVGQNVMNLPGTSYDWPRERVYLRVTLQQE